MSTDNKVVWSEGMFLRTQHFQQADRYLEKLVRGSVAGLRPYAWGITELQINRELLATGKFAIASCRGVMEDGTPFAVPEDADHRLDDGSPSIRLGGWLWLRGHGSDPRPLSPDTAG